jgi:hypothetical protein
MDWGVCVRGDGIVQLDALAGSPQHMEKMIGQEVPADCRGVYQPNACDM